MPPKASGTARPCSRGTVDVQWTSSGRYSGRPKTGFVAQWTSTLIEEWLSLPSQFDLTSTVRKPRFLDVHCNVHCTSTGRPLCIRYTAHPTREARFFFWLAHAPLGGAHTWLPRGGPSHSPRRGGDPGNAPRPIYEPTDSRPPSRGGDVSKVSHIVLSEGCQPCSCHTSS